MGYLQNYTGSSPNFANYSNLTNDPLSAQVNQAYQDLESQQSANSLATLANDAQIQQLTTQNDIRTAIQAAMQQMANQAKSLSKEFIGDEVAQTKKDLENAGKAV